MTRRFSIVRMVAIVMALSLPLTAFAGKVGKAGGGGNSLDFQLSVSGHQSIDVRVSAPDGEIYSMTFENGKPVSIRLKDLGATPVDGSYNYEMIVTPRISAGLARKLEAARAANDDAAARKIMRENGIAEPTTQSGSFRVENGSILDPNAVESSANAVSDEAAVRDSAPSRNVTRATPKVGVNDQVIPDDLIVQGSACVGFDCVNNESFGFDTIRMKENNLRIKAEDTSAGSFPTSDWQLTFNDSASGGANKFSVEDITSATVPLTVTGGAPTNSLFVDSTGRAGFRTSTPVLDLHVSTSNTPAHRLEQTNAGGFTAQTWDVAGNEANFFVRDVTGGSRLPFRIRPGATTSSIDISSTGSVGINDASPNTNAKLDVNGAQRFEGVVSPTTDNAAWVWNESGVGLVAQAGGSVRVRTGAVSSDRLTVTTAGDVGINCNAPTADLAIFSTSNCSGSGSTINAGATQFTVTSSRMMKENLEEVAVPNLLERIASVGVYKYDFKVGPKDRVGLMAEDFHQVFGRGSDKVIDGNEVQMALWLAVQQLTAQNKELLERLNTLETELSKKQ